MTAPTFETVRIDLPPRQSENLTAELVLDRPKRLNALSRQLLHDIIDASRWFDTTDIKVVLVRGEGRAFSAGFDLDEFAGPDASGPSRSTADLGRLAVAALTDTRPLTVAAIHGHCVGGGLLIAAACDLRLASTTVRFSIPEVDLGIPLAWSGIPRLVREIGPAATKELVLTCRPFGGDEAVALGLLNRAVADDELLGDARSLVTELASKPMFSIQATKQHVNAVMDEIAGVGRNVHDADTLAAALRDAESRQISARYLADRGKQ